MKLPLPHRKVIRFVGKDAQSFIQGLFSNDVLHFESNPSTKNIVYGAFLNGNGRVVTDGFVFYDKSLLSNPEHSPAQEIFAEIDGSSQETSARLLRHLEAFKMRADVKMSVVEDVKVEVEIKQQEENTSKEEGGLTDPRSSMENVTRSYSLSNNNTTNNDENVDTSPYFNYLYERGVCEGDKLWSQIRLPFEGNLDIIGGIHYRKGCYIGQELVQRAKTQLVSRKRIVPFQSTHPLSVGMDLINLLPTTEEEGENNTKPKKKPAVVGKVIDCIENAASGKNNNNTNTHIGVCSLRLAESLNAETLEATLTTSKKEEDGGVVKISANVPYWWPDDEIDKCIPLADEGEDGGQGEKDE